MDELISLIVHGVKLAREIEPMLQTMASQQEMVSKLDEIIRVFITVRERLNSIQDPNLYSQMLYRELQQQEHYRKSMMELFQTQFMAEAPPPPPSLDMGSRDVQTVAASSSSQRQRRRKDDGEKRTERVPAPRMGNTEIPPEDGFTWRKYGQKEILGSRFPRSYYRCTHQKLYQCPAKKQVQRLDDDPSTFEVTYRGEHTCHMSATAPSSAPPPPPPPPPPQDPSMAAAGLPWLEFSLGGAGAGPSSGGGTRSDQFLVADLADAMFNSGSSSSNSMELIFTTAPTSSTEDKWDKGDNKKI